MGYFFFVSHLETLASRILEMDSVVSELCVTSPMIERMGAKFAENVTAPRLLKSHFAFKNMPKSAKAKYIFACRNPKDCLTR
jgi:hypothetical protein